jgi:hypothetical protein
VGSIGWVTTTAHPSAAISSARPRGVSSMLTITWVGASARSLSKFTCLVPPTLRARRTCPWGCTQNAVRPTTLAPRPRSNNSSVMLGTSETIRAASPTGRCTRPAASISTASGGACGGMGVIPSLSSQDIVIPRGDASATVPHPHAPAPAPLRRLEEPKAYANDAVAPGAAAQVETAEGVFRRPRTRHRRRSRKRPRLPRFPPLGMAPPARFFPIRSACTENILPHLGNILY